MPETSESIQRVQKPLFHRELFIIAYARSGDVFITCKNNDRNYFIGANEYRLLEQCDGTKTIKELTALQSRYDENDICQFVIFTHSLGLLGEPPPRRFDVTSLKLPLFNPSRLIKCGSKPSIFIKNTLFALCILSLLFCGYALLAHSDTLFGLTAELNLFRWQNLIRFLVSYVILAFFHESAHALVLMGYGLPVVRVGVMLNFFTPACYTDVAGVRRLRNRGQRITVWLAGVMAQTIILGITIAVLIFCPLSEALYDNVGFFLLANAVTIVMNLFFVIRLDGYHILCELFEDESLRDTADAYMAHPFRAEHVQLQNDHKLAYTAVSLLTRLFLPIFALTISTNAIIALFENYNSIIYTVFPVMVCINIPIIIIRRILRRRRAAR